MASGVPVGGILGVLVNVTTTVTLGVGVNGVAVGVGVGGVPVTVGVLAGDVPVTVGGAVAGVSTTRVTTTVTRGVAVAVGAGVPVVGVPVDGVPVVGVCVVSGVLVSGVPVDGVCVTPGVPVLGVPVVGVCVVSGVPVPGVPVVGVPVDGVPVPVIGVFFGDWSTATTLVVYWSETLLTAVSTGVRIAVHRKLTRKKGHYRDHWEKSPPVKARPAKPRQRFQTFLSGFLTGSLILIFGLGLFLALLLATVLEQGIDRDAIESGMFWMAVAQGAGLAWDLIGIRERPFA